MFIGAQVSLYPMTSDFLSVIETGLEGLNPYRDDLRIETDDISTLMVGAPGPLFDGLRDLFAGAARRPEHVTMHATLSRGCPGAPDDPTCRCDTLIEAQDQSLDERKALALKAVEDAPKPGVANAVRGRTGRDPHVTENPATGEHVRPILP